MQSDACLLLGNRKEDTVQRNKRFNTIRTRMMLSLFAITVLGFGVVLFTVSHVVEDYFFNQRISEVRAQMQQWVDSIQGPFLQRDGKTLYKLTSQYVQQDKGHILLVDSQGVVQTDTAMGASISWAGQAIGDREVQDVLWGGESFSTGRRQYPLELAEEDANWFTRRWPPKGWTMYYVDAIPDAEGKTIGALFYSASISDVMDHVNDIRMQIALAMVLVLAAMMIASYFLARSVTNPIVSLTRTIRRMARGEFSLRTPVMGRGELAELGATFNDMSERLENNEKFRNEFVSNASHELKTPLATMKILIESLIYQDKMDEGMTREFLGDINSEIDRLNGVITDLLHLVQVDKHETGIKREESDIAEICANVVKRLQPLVAKRNIDLETELSPVVANVDRIKMDQVILNLTENAIKYSDDGKHVLLACYPEGDYAVIRVKDEGVGIPKEDQGHVFDRFYRVDKARSRATGGTGLGLSIVDGIVKMHGGRIELESELGEGSQFTVYIPLTAANRGQE